ncbi:hypothetical protein FRB98_006373 [Tulasnella sp. 332]|nr:hypothetical protein FRB98_006373 [Tulasnella sp. 332]
MMGSQDMVISSKANTPTKESEPKEISKQQSARLDVHQPFSTFPAGALIDEFFSHSEAEGEFHKESMRRMFDLLLEFKIWSESRPAQEIDQFGDQMDEQLKAIQAKEEEQGTSSSSASTFVYILERSRRNLVAFFTSIQAALSALASFGGVAT